MIYLIISFKETILASNQDLPKINASLPIIEAHAGQDFTVKTVDEMGELDGSVIWLIQLNAKLIIVRGYILRLIFDDTNLWETNYYYHLQVSENLQNWQWEIINQPIDKSKPYVVYPKTIKENQFFKLYVSNIPFNFQ